MKDTVATLLLLVVLYLATQGQTSNQPKSKSAFLENLSWVEAEKVIKPESVVVIALGAQAKEHGPHLPLATDFIQAEYYKNRVAERLEIIVAPTINYGLYPAFIEYPGSTTVRLSASRNMVADICRSLARFGVKRFYIINIGVSTKPALEQAAKSLAAEGILLHFTDVDKTAQSVVKQVKTEERGSHAHEIETSIMLYIAPQSVDMKKAVKDYGIEKGVRTRLTRNPQSKHGLYSPSGVFGDATLATRQKGKIIVEAMVEGISKEIEDLRRAALPKAESFEEIYNSFVGQYEIAPGDRITITRENEFLAAEQTGKPKVLMIPFGKYEFSGYTAEAAFFTDTGGKVTHMVFSTGGQDFLGKKVK